MFIPFYMKIGHLGIWEPNYYTDTRPDLLKSVPNTSGNWFRIIFQCKHLVLGHFHDIHFIVRDFETISVRSQHLQINSGLEPVLKCAPGLGSMEDFSIIKSDRLKNGVVGFQNCNLGFWAIVARGQFKYFLKPNSNRFRKCLNWCAICQPATSLIFSEEISKQVTPEPGFPRAMRLWMYDSGLWVTTNLKMSESYWSGKPSGEVSPVQCFSWKSQKLFSKKQFEIGMGPGNIIQILF